jgi:hypothetical protein
VFLLLFPNNGGKITHYITLEPGFTMKAKNLENEMFGKLTVLSRNGSLNGAAAWMCKCVCGTIRTVRADALVQGKTTSCGCQKLVARSQRGPNGPVEPIYRVVIHQSIKFPSKTQTIRTCVARIYDRVSDAELARIPPVTLTIGPGAMHPMMKRVMARMGVKDDRLFKVRRITSNDHYGIAQEYKRWPDLPPEAQYYPDPQIGALIRGFKNEI